MKKAESLKFIDKSKLNYRRIMSFETDFTEKSEKEELELVKTYDQNPFFRERVNIRLEKKEKIVSKEKSLSRRSEPKGERKINTFRDIKQEIITKASFGGEKLRSIAVKKKNTN